MLLVLFFFVSFFSRPYSTASLPSKLLSAMAKACSWKGGVRELLEPSAVSYRASRRWEHNQGTETHLRRAHGRLKVHGEGVVSNAPKLQHNVVLIRFVHQLEIFDRRHRHAAPKVEHVVAAL